MSIIRSTFLPEDEKMFAGVQLIEPTILFNIINTEFKFPAMTNPMYLLLLDLRLWKNYCESHIITAKFVKKKENEQFEIPKFFQIKNRQNIVVYDHDTSAFDTENSTLLLAYQLWLQGSREPVKVIKGGYKLFSSAYPFFRSRKVFNMPKELDSFETYPAEIIPSFLYIGKLDHSLKAYIQKDLNIQRHVNCSSRQSMLYPTVDRHILNVNSPKNEDLNLFFKLKTICNFIDFAFNEKCKVLVYSDDGISRVASVAIAFYIHKFKVNYQTAYKHLEKCCPKICVSRRMKLLLQKLSIQEKDKLLSGKKIKIEKQVEIKKVEGEEDLYFYEKSCPRVASSVCFPVISKRIKSEEEKKEEKEEEEEELKEQEMDYFKKKIFGDDDMKDNLRIYDELPGKVKKKPEVMLEDMYADGLEREGFIVFKPDEEDGDSEEEEQEVEKIDIYEEDEEEEEEEEEEGLGISGEEIKHIKGESPSEIERRIKLKEKIKESRKKISEVFEKHKDSKMDEYKKIRKEILSHVSRKEVPIGQLDVTPPILYNELDEHDADASAMIKEFQLDLTPLEIQYEEDLLDKGA